MTVIWAVVANSSFAQVYQIKGHGKEIQEIHLFDNPDGRLRNGDFDSDKPGRAFDSLGGGRHAYEKQVDPHMHELKEFASKLSSFITKARNEKQFDELALVAPAQFIGVLRDSLSTHVQEMITKEVHKDLPLSITGKARLDQLSEYLDLWNR